MHKTKTIWDQFLDQKEVIEFFRFLIQTPSENPPGDTSKIARLIEKKCLEIGLDTKIISKIETHENVIAVMEGNNPGPTLLFNGHMDTVPVGDITEWTEDPFGATVKENRIYGRGASDMLGGVAAMIMATKLIKDAGIEIDGKVILTMVADEETGGMLGTNFVMEQGIRADAAIVTEPSEMSLTLANKGSYWFRLTTKGRAAHASVPDQGINAVEMMAKIIANIDRLELAHQIHPLLDGPSISPGTVIQGGSKSNVIPDSCSATFDIRIVPGQEYHQVRKEVNDFLEEMMQEDSRISFELEELASSDPVEIDKDEKIVQIAEAAVKEISGQEPKINGTPGGCDAFHIKKYGIPTIPFFGPGSLNLAHKRDEYIIIDELIAMTKVYAEIMMNYCKRTDIN